MRTLLLLILLAGCQSPSLAFMDAPAQTIDVDGMSFTVRVKNEAAEAFRTSFEALPRERDVFARAATAIERVSGCAVARIDGDAALIRADLDCPG